MVHLVAGVAMVLTSGCGSERGSGPAAADALARVPSLAEPHARPTLVLASPTVAPGKTIDLGVSFKIEPGWHMYWNGRNDSGQPPTVEFELPQGVTAGEFLWPVPKRQVLPGDILDHIYEDELTVIVPLTIDAAIAPGTSLTIKANCSWMVCSNVCLVENGSTHANLAVTAPSSKSGPSEPPPELSRARARLPQVLDAGSKALKITPEAEASRNPGTAGVRAIELTAEGAVAMEFYPDPACAELAEPIQDTRARGARLHIRFKTPQVDGEKSLTGIVGVWKGGGVDPAYYLLRAGRPR